ncbi:MAG: type II secretion system F family protein, partial [Pseudomonadota bacterium]
MTAFRYEAVDVSGRKKRGVITADTVRRARKEIQGAGLTPLSIKSVQNRREGKNGAKTASPKTKDMIAATRQLATLIDASTTVEESLAAVGAQMKGSMMADILLAIRARIIEGWRMSDALAEYPKTFTPLYRGIVAAGEESGNLGPVMLRLADMVEKNRAMAMKALT